MLLPVLIYPRLSRHKKRMNEKISLKGLVTNYGEGGGVYKTGGGGASVVLPLRKGRTEKVVKPC